MLSAEEFVKSNETCCDREPTSQAPDSVSDVSRNLAVEVQQQAIDVQCNYVDSGLRSGVFDSSPLFPSITVRNDLPCDFTLCGFTSKLAYQYQRGTWLS